MKQKRAFRNYTPLEIAFSLWADGGVSATQSYNADLNEFAPDWSVTPLIIRLNLSVTDKDSKTTSRLENKLTDISWYEIKNGVRTLIDASNSNYVIIRDTTAYNGSIKVVKNILDIDEVVTLEFNGSYLDSRNNTIHQFKETVLLRTTASASAALFVKFDSGTLVLYNPIEDAANMTFTPQMFLGVNKVTDASLMKFWYYVVNSDGTLTPVGDSLAHIWYVSQTSASITINRENITERIQIRCKAEYFMGEAPVAPTDNAVECDVIVARQYPPWEEEVFTPEALGANVTKSFTKAVIHTPKGVVGNPEDYFFIRHYIKPATSGASWTEIGHGEMASYDASTIDNSTNKAVDVGIEVTELKGFAAAVNESGAFFLNENGNVIIFR